MLWSYTYLGSSIHNKKNPFEDLKSIMSSEVKSNGSESKPGVGGSLSSTATSNTSTANSKSNSTSAQSSVQGSNPGSGGGSCLFSRLIGEQC